MADSDDGGFDFGGPMGSLGSLFVIFKLTGVIDWSWWWVTSPFWGALLVLLAGCLLALVAGFITWTVKRLGE